MTLKTKAFGDIITFTRASGGGRFNSSGVYEYVGNNVPRLDYDPVTLQPKGLLIEEQRTNLVTYSSDFANAAWTKQWSSIASGATLAPDNVSLADKLVESTAAGNHRVLRLSASSIGTVFSVFLKAAERTSCTLAIENITTGDRYTSSTTFNLAAGTVIAGTGTITPAGNGWYRCTVVAVSPSNSAPFIYLRNATGDSYTGDGTSGIYVWGAQLEAGAFPTSYIPTTTAQVTRAADVASVNDLSPWYNASEGTLFVEWQTNYDAGDKGGIFALDDGTTQNNINGRQFTSRTTRVAVVTGNTVQAANNGASIPLGNTVKGAIAYGPNDFRWADQGVVRWTDSAGTVPTVAVLRIGINNSGGSNYLNGHIKSIRYFPRALSSAELQEITA